MENINQLTNHTKKNNIITPISNNIIDKLNAILEKNNNELVIKKLEVLKKYAQKKYKKLETYKQKEEFIFIVLKNITKLLNNLEYIDVYNTDAILNKSTTYYSKVSDIKKITTTNTDKNIEWWDCNSQLLYFYWLIKSITNNDNFIKYRFFSDIRGNHWKLYIITKNNKYLYHRQEKHLLIKTNNIFENKKIQIEDFNENDFLNTKNNIWFNQNKISYRFWYKYLQIKSTLFWIKLKIKSSKNEIPHIKIRWFKRLSKKIYKMFNFVHLWKKSKFKNYTYDELIKYIISEIKNHEDQEMFIKVLEKINKEKMKNIFLLKSNK